MNFGKLEIGDTFQVYFNWFHYGDAQFIKVPIQYDICDAIYPLGGEKANAVCIDERAPTPYKGQFFYFGPRRRVSHVNWGGA